MARVWPGMSVRVDPTGPETRDLESREGQSVGEIQGRDLGSHAEPNVSGIRHRWREVEADAELAEFDRDRTSLLTALHAGKGEFASGEEGRFLSLSGDQIRLRQATEVTGIPEE